MLRRISGKHDSYSRAELKPANAPPFFSQRTRIRVAKRTPVFSEKRACKKIYRGHEEKHLRALCRRHYVFQAERVYGIELIQAKIDARKRK